MNSTILNREFRHPSDGWYQIEALGNHPNRAAGVVQVIDAEAAQSIVNTFNADAAAGRLRQGNELLIDHEHFSDQDDQESRAYGWLQELQNRADGIYGRIRWTSTGQAAVDGGDYRFFSTEYNPKSLKIVNDDKPRRVRPLRLDGLTLTNMNNNRGQKPITNRSLEIKTKPLPADGQCPDCDVALQPDEDDGKGVMVCPKCKTHFAGVSAPAANQKQNTNKTMNKVATKLGLAAEASEDAILDAVTKILNRTAELEPLAEQNKTLKARVEQMDTDQVAGVLTERGITDEKVVNRLQPVLAGIKNREERLAFLDDCGFKAAAKTADQSRILNRGKGPVSEVAGETDEKAVAIKIKNRATELKGVSPSRSFDSCWQQAHQEVTARK